MKIINKTHWRTDHLRAFVTRVASEELEADKRKTCVVKFVHSRSRGVSGYAYRIGGNSCLVRVPRKDVNKPALAMVIAHELAHCRGAKSGRSGEYDLRSSARYGYRGDYKTFYAWANDMPFEQKAPKAKPATPAIDDKIAHVEKAILKWQRKEKLAKTHLRKWNRKLKYYTKKLAAMNATQSKPE